jgi:hypothetical protein
VCGDQADAGEGGQSAADDHPHLSALCPAAAGSGGELDCPGERCPSVVTDQSASDKRPGNPGEELRRVVGGSDVFDKQFARL